MRKRKELIIIVLIISLTIILGFLPLIINNNDEEIKEEINEENDLIKITIKGEIQTDKLEIEIPYGYSYGYIISKITLYLNEYSIIDKDLTKRYFEDSVIIIDSIDKDNNYNEYNSDLININEADYNTLITLYGIGEKRANKIIEYRNNKRIEDFDELKKMIGVSNEIIERIKEKAFL